MSAQHDEVADEVQITSVGPLEGTIRVPGDKSISHRALMFAALADGESVLTGLSAGEDVVRTRQAMKAMGAEIFLDGATWRIRGGEDRLHEPHEVIDLGNSGTGMRLMSGWCASMPWFTVLSGDESLHRRPMRRVVEPLREMGAQIDGRGGGEWAPLAVRGGNLHGIRYQPPVASAQLKSAVLIAGLKASGETVVYEPVPTRAHTEEMLAEAGADIVVDEKPDGSVEVRLRPSQLKAVQFDVPGDPSQAAFWMVAGAVVPGSDITIERVYVGPGRGGIIDVLSRMGADIDIDYIDGTTANIRVRYSQLTGVEVGGEEVPTLIDELPVLSVAAAMASGRTVVTDAAEMRVKESDRIAAVVHEIGGLGIDVEERSDGFVIEGRPNTALAGGRVHSDLDHRVAMTAAIAALVSENPVDISGWSSVHTSYPSFLDDLESLRS